jgi:hypothetical protein
MAKKLHSDEVVSLEEVVISNVFTQEALINILVKKGLINKKELLEEISRLRIKE